MWRVEAYGVKCHGGVEVSYCSYSPACNHAFCYSPILYSFWCLLPILLLCGRRSIHSGRRRIGGVSSVPFCMSTYRLGLRNNILCYLYAHYHVCPYFGFVDITLPSYRSYADATLLGYHSPLTLPFNTNPLLWDLAYRSPLLVWTVADVLLYAPPHLTNRVVPFLQYHCSCLDLPNIVIVTIPPYYSISCLVILCLPNYLRRVPASICIPKTYLFMLSLFV